MSILILGTKCPLCQKPIESGDSITAFPPFVDNEADPLWKFSDNSFHTTCFEHDALAASAVARYKLFTDNLRSKNRQCFICKKRIAVPDDYFAFGYMTDDPSNRLYSLNYHQAHKSCLAKWDSLAETKAALKGEKQLGMLKGHAVDSMLQELDTVRN